MIHLQCPYGLPTKDLVMKSPELQDAHTYQQKVKFDKAMDGTIYTFVTTPNNEKFSWHFKNLTLEEREEIIAFLIFAQGQAIQLTDFNGVNFKVMCTTPILQLTTTGLGVGQTTRKEAVSIDLQFEVVP